MPSTSVGGSSSQVQLLGERGGIEALNAVEATGVIPDSGAASSGDLLSSIGNAKGLSDLLTPVSSNSFLKGEAKTSLSAAVKRDKGAAAGTTPSTAGKTGERSGNTARDKEVMPGLGGDPVINQTTFGSDPGDFLAQLTKPSDGLGQDKKDPKNTKDQDKKDNKESPKEKAEREQVLKSALSGEMTEGNYNTVADQIQNHGDDVKRMIGKDSSLRKNTIGLIDQFSPKDTNHPRSVTANRFRNFLERESSNAGVLDEVGSAGSVRPTVHQE